MIDFIFWAVGFFLIGLGILGCFVNRIPGALVAFLGILELHFFTKVEFTTEALLLVGGLTLLATILAKRAPAIVSKIYQVGNPGKWGSTIGSIIGLLIISSGVSDSSLGAIFMFFAAFVVVPLGLSFLFELIKLKKVDVAFKTGLASYVSFLIGVMLNLSVCGYGLYVAVCSIK